MLPIQERSNNIYFPLKFQENALGMMNNCILKSIFSSTSNLDITFTPIVVDQKTLYIASESALSDERAKAFIQSFFASDRRLRSFIHNALLEKKGWGEVVLAGNYLSHYTDIYGVLVLPRD